MTKREMPWKREIGPHHDGATRLAPGVSMGARISERGEVLGNPRGVTQVLRMGECDVRFEIHRRTPEGTPMSDAQRDALRGVVTAMLVEGLKAAGDASGIVILPGTKASADLGGVTMVSGEVLRYVPGTEIVIRESSDDLSEWTISLVGNALSIRGDSIHIGPAVEDDDGEAGECDDEDDGVSGACWDEDDPLMHPGQGGTGDSWMDEVARSMAEREVRVVTIGRTTDATDPALLARQVREDDRMFSVAVNRMTDCDALVELLREMPEGSSQARSVAHRLIVVLTQESVACIANDDLVGLLDEIQTQTCLDDVCRIATKQQLMYVAWSSIYTSTRDAANRRLMEMR